MAPPPGDSPGILLAWLQGILRAHGLYPAKRLGQHFLYHPKGISYFTGRLGPGDWLEIGPGAGLLTYYAAEKVGRLVAVELDRRMALLAGWVHEYRGNVSVVWGDGLDALGYVGARGLLSNTPYNLTAPIIRGAARSPSVEEAVLGVQWEVAARMTAEPGTRDYGRLTLLVKRYFHVELVARLPARWFYPRPDVDGAVVYLRRKRQWMPGDEAFEALTACLFSQRNKSAYKVAARCAGVSREEARRRFGEKRVRDLVLEEVEWLLAAGGRSE